MGGSKSKKVKIGYWYYFGIHMGWGRGPIDELLHIKVGDITAWEGSVTSTTSFAIDQPDLFGGEKGEGGIQGQAYVYMGDQNQATPAPIAAMLGTMGVPCPAFRGTATFFYDGKVCALNPYPKPWKFRLRRALRGWENENPWYPAKAVISMAGGTIKAMNPAHVIYQSLTDRSWGRSLNTARLNVASFTAAADKLYAEGFGICLRWNRGGSVSEFIQTIIDCIGGVLEINRRTGLLSLKLIRDDYVVANLPTFTFGTGLLDVEDYETAAQDSAVNQVTVKYHDPVTDEDMITPPVDNLAAIQTTQSTKPQQYEFLMVPTMDLAARLATRELQAASGDIRKLTCVLDRRGANCAPGDVINIVAPSHGIANMTVRVLSYKDGSLADGEVTLVVAQDVFGLPATHYVEAQPPGWVPPDRTARQPTVRIMREASYRDVLQNAPAATLQSIAATSAFAQGLATKPLGLALGYELWTNSNNVQSSFEERSAGDWVPLAVLGAALPLSADDVTVPLAAYSDMTLYEVGQTVFIDNEELIISGRNVNLGTLTLQRGALDTVPAAHAEGAQVWMYSDYQAFDPHEWVVGTTVYGRFLTYTTQGQLTIDQASSVSLALTGRQGKPYPPGNVYINGQRYYNVATLTGDPTFTWAHRDRISQDDQLFPHTYGSVGPETGVTYTIDVRNSGGGLVRSTPGITGTTWTYTNAMAIADGSLSDLTFELYSVRASIASWQKYSMNLKRVGLGLFLGQFLGGA